MPDGDLADLAGLEVFLATQDIREGYNNDNIRGDEIADHILNGGHDAAKITGLSTLLAAKADSSAMTTALAGKAPSSTTTTANNAAAAAAQARQGDMDIAVWVRDVSAYTRAAVWMGFPGQVLLGFAPSTRASKTDIRAVDLTLEQLRAIPVIFYRYLAAIAREKDEPGFKAATEIGTIADDLHELGLWPFVMYEQDKHGRTVIDKRTKDAIPRGVHYELLGLAAIRLGQLAHDRLDDLEQRLAKIEKGA